MAIVTEETEEEGEVLARQSCNPNPRSGRPGSRPAAPLLLTRTLYNISYSLIQVIVLMKHTE